MRSLRSASFDVPAGSVASDGFNRRLSRGAWHGDVDQKLGGLEQFVHGLLRGRGVRDKREGQRQTKHAGVKQNVGEIKRKRSFSLPSSLAAASPSVRVSKHRQMKVVISRDVKHLIMPEGPVIPDASDEAAPNEGRRDVGSRAKSSSGNKKTKRGFA